MKFLRRLLGIFVMIAGVIGLLLSIAGLIGIWYIKPTLVATAGTTINTLTTSIETSKKVVDTTQQALGATVASVDALSEMLETTAASVEDTQPMLDRVNLVLGDTIPATFEDATASLKTSQEAAAVMESTLKSLDNFRMVLSATPFLSAMVEAPDVTYNPDVALADSLGDLAKNLEAMPETFTGMSEDMDRADDNLVMIRGNLMTMSTSVGLISTSLSEYQAMLSQSQSSMDSLGGMLESTRANLPMILNGASAVLTLFFLWLLAAQIVIFSQGWELFHGTAGSMAGGEEADEATTGGTPITA